MLIGADVLTGWDDAYLHACMYVCLYVCMFECMHVLQVAQDFLALYERALPWLPWLAGVRQRALRFVIRYIHAEDKQTNYVDIGPVNKALNMLSVFVDAGCSADTEAFQRHIARVDDYIWVAEDGVKMQGYNGSQCWDTSFTVRAMVEGGLATEFPECARKVKDADLNIALFCAVHLLLWSYYV